ATSAVIANGLTERFSPLMRHLPCAGIDASRGCSGQTRRGQSGRQGALRAAADAPARRSWAVRVLHASGHPIFPAVTPWDFDPAFEPSPRPASTTSREIPPRESAA